VSIELQPGPVARIPAHAVPALEAGESIVEFVAAHLDDLAGADDRIGGNVRLMADDLDGDAEIDPLGALDGAAAEQPNERARSRLRARRSRGASR
jgi:hypothetical protein